MFYNVYVNAHLVSYSPRFWSWVLCLTRYRKLDHWRGRWIVREEIFLIPIHASFLLPFDRDNKLTRLCIENKISKIYPRRWFGIVYLFQLPCTYVMPNIGSQQKLCLELRHVNGTFIKLIDQIYKHHLPRSLTWQMRLNWNEYRVMENKKERNLMALKTKSLK